MNDKRNWLMETVIVIVLIAVGLFAVVVISCLVNKPCGFDLCAYRPADWLLVLVQYGVAGAFGGILTLMSQVNPNELIKSNQDLTVKPHLTNVLLAVFISGMGGIGGAGAALYFMIFNGKLQIPKGDSDRLWMDDLFILNNCMIGLIAGFLGFTFLRQIATSFANWTQLKNETVKDAQKAAREEVEQFQAKFAALQTLYDVCRRAREFRDKHKGDANRGITDPEFVRIYGELEVIRRQFPENREAAIVLANMSYDKKDFAKAIAVIEETIAAIEKDPATANEKNRLINLAALRYNRACYQSRLIENLDKAGKEQHLGKVMDDLRQSGELDPEILVDLEKDVAPGGDLVHLFESETFKQFVDQIKLKWKK